MPRKKQEREALNIGEVAFLAGILIAVIAGILTTFNVGIEETLVRGILLLLGTVVGFLNLKKEEYTNFLVVGLVFLIPGGLEVFSKIPVISQLLSNISVFVAPAVLIVAIKALIDLAATK